MGLIERWWKSLRWQDLRLNCTGAYDPSNQHILVPPTTSVACNTCWVDESPTAKYAYRGGSLTKNGGYEEVIGVTVSQLDTGCFRKCDSRTVRLLLYSVQSDPLLFCTGGV